jgi:lipopolysaccharide transport system permease protein
MNVITPDQGPTTAAEISAPSRSRIVSITASHNWRSRWLTALADLKETYRLSALVWTLSLLDIRLRYRGSLLGPFWLTLSTAVMVASIGLLYAKLFHQDVSKYLPFLTISLVLWNFLQTITAEGAVCYSGSEGMIRAMRMPLSLHAARIVTRNVLVLAHNLIVILIVFGIFRTTPSSASFSVIPACLLWVIDGFCLSVILGVFGARFRDIPPIVASIVQIMFYMTPIMWSPAMLSGRGLSLVFIQWNPAFAMLDIIRGPLLGDPLDGKEWLIATGYSAIIILLATFIFVRARARIAYWV